MEDEEGGVQGKGELELVEEAVLDGIFLDRLKQTNYSVANSARASPAPNTVTSLESRHIETERLKTADWIWPVSGSVRRNPLAGFWGSFLRFFRKEKSNSASWIMVRRRVSAALMATCCD
jgi:hypothetical protein